MGIVSRGVIFSIGTVSNAILFLFLSRVLLPLLETGRDIAGTGPATGAMDLLPMALQLAIGIIQIGLVVYFIGGIGQQSNSNRRPMS